MRSVVLLAGAAILLAAAKPAPAPLHLADGGFDPALLIPPPPATASREAREDIEELRAIDRANMPGDQEAAAATGRQKDWSIFAAAIGPGFDPGRLPATRALFETLRGEEKAAVDRAKAYFHRNRPWIVDPALHTCTRSEEPQSSYPSGHATNAFSMAAILARLIPSRAPAIMAKAADYAHSRLVCEQHFRSDIVAGQAFGMVIAERLMQQPAFRAQFAAAQREIAMLRS